MAQRNIYFAIVLVLCFQAASSRFLAHSSRNHRVDQDPSHKLAMVEVLENTSIMHEHTDDCMCNMGEFWHWRIKQCIKQGPWGYECGFFPGEHHRFVCMDGLKCDKLDQTKLEYQHPGAVPASCKQCEDSDHCLKGEERQSEECLKEDKLSGEACATVRVTLVANATATVTKEHTATASVNESATVDATASATGEGSASREGVGEAKACVTIEEVKEELDLSSVKRVGPVLAARIIAKGDKMAFDHAYEKAMAVALEAADSKASDAAKAAAAEKAAMEAKMQAEADAAEKAAWETEAGMSGATEDAYEEAEKEADAAAAKAAEEAAPAPAAPVVTPAPPTADPGAMDDLVDEVTGKNPQADTGIKEKKIPGAPTLGPVPRKIPEKEFKDRFP